MPTSVATHASLLLKAAAAKPFFSPRAAARIPPPPPRAPAAGRLPPATAGAGTSRWFRWQSARGLCAAPHSGGGAGGEGMGSDAGVGARRRAVNGLAKELPAVNGMSKEDPQPPRLLTLPTVLTIGRVAAVPLLISSELKPFSPFNSSCVFLLVGLSRAGKMDTGSSVSFLGALRSWVVAMWEAPQ